MTNKTASEISKNKNNFRYKIGAIDRNNCTSAYINIQTRVRQYSENPLGDDISYFKRAFRTFTYQLSNELKLDLRSDILRSVDYSDSDKKGTVQSICNIELTFLFSDTLHFRDRVELLDTYAARTIEFISKYPGLEITGSIK